MKVLKRFVAAVLLMSCPVLMAQAVRENACSEADEKAAEEVSQRFFAKFREHYSLEDVRGEFVSVEQCRSVYDPPLMDVDKKFRERLDCASIKRFEEGGFEFFLVLTEYAMGRENVDVPSNDNEILDFLPKEAAQAIKKSPSLSRAFSEQNSGNEEISNERQLREVSDSLEEVTALIREYLKAHPEWKERVPAGIKRMESNVGATPFQTRCTVSDDERFYGSPDGTPIIEMTVFPYWIVLAREDGQWKIARVSFIDD